MYCTKCGHEATENDVFCTKCGHSFKEKTKVDKFVDWFTNKNYNYKEKKPPKGYLCPVCEKIITNKSYLSNANFNGQKICENCIDIINYYRGGEKAGTIFLEELQAIVNIHKKMISTFKISDVPIEIRNSYGILLNNFYKLDAMDQHCIIESKYDVPYEIYCDVYKERKHKGTLPRDYVVFDTETTGLYPEHDRIIEISAIKYKNSKKVDTFSTLVNPEVPITSFITDLTGITNNDLKDKPLISEVLPQFFEFIEDYTLAAHNAPYDIKMLASECYRNNIPLCDNKIVDTVTLAKRLFPKDQIEDYKLETLKYYLNLNFKSHRALDDCKVCAKIYQLYLLKKDKRKVITIDAETGEIIEDFE